MNEYKIKPGFEDIADFIFNNNYELLNQNISHNNSLFNDSL